MAVGMTTEYDDLEDLSALRLSDSFPSSRHRILGK